LIDAAAQSTCERLRGGMRKMRRDFARRVAGSGQLQGGEQQSRGDDLDRAQPHGHGRAQQLEVALDIASRDPPRVERGDAADWIETQLAIEPEQGVCRLVLHTIALQYFPAEAQERVKARLRQAGAKATEAAPLAWLRLEMLPTDDKISLRLRTWPGDGRLLAWSHPHASWINWL